MAGMLQSTKRCANRCFECYGPSHFIAAASWCPGDGDGDGEGDGEEDGEEDGDEGGDRVLPLPPTK